MGGRCPQRQQRAQEEPEEVAEEATGLRRSISSRRSLVAWITVIRHLQGVRRTQRRWSYLAQHLKCYPASLRERLCLVYPTGKEEEAKAAK